MQKNEPPKIPHHPVEPTLIDMGGSGFAAIANAIMILSWVIFFCFVYVKECS
jgi:hypothetical protein